MSDAFHATASAHTNAPIIPAFSMRDVLTATILFVAAMAYFSLSWAHTLDLRDEGYLLARAAQVAAGEIPHRDFSDTYGPLVFTLSGGIIKLSDGSIFGMRVGIAVWKAFAVVLSYLLARFLTPRPFALSGAIVAIAYWGRPTSILNSPYASVWTVPLCLASALALLLALRRDRPFGYAAAGAIAGVGVLAKQSLGIMSLYGLLLAVSWISVARHDVTESPESVRRSGRPGLVESIAAVLWAVSGIAVLLPLASYLTWRDYFLHFFVLHLGMGVMGVVLWQRFDIQRLILSARGILLPYAVGAAVAPVSALLAYAAWGALDALYFDMFTLPGSIRNYYLPAILPPLSLCVFAIGALAVADAVLHGWRGASRAALFAAIGGMLLILMARFAIPFSNPDLYRATTALRWPFAFEATLAPAISLVGVTILVSGSRRGVRDAGERVREVEALVVMLFTQFMLALQVFPRGAQNYWVLHGALAPLAAVALYHWVRPWRTVDSSSWRNRAALTTALLVPAYLVAPIVYSTIGPSADAGTRRSLALPGAERISLTANEIRRRHLDDVEELVAHLATISPPDAPVFVLNNQEGIRFFAGRPHLFPHHAYALFLTGWDMLPAAQTKELDGDDMLRTLRGAADAILIHAADPSSRRLRRALPRVASYIDQHFEVQREFGIYRVLRRVDTVQPSSDLDTDPTGRTKGVPRG